MAEATRGPTALPRPPRRRAAPATRRPRRVVGALVVALAAVGILGGALAAAPAPVFAQTDTFPSSDGEIRITPFAGASVQLEHRGVVVHVDPWSRGDYAAALPADVVLVTDTPADHLDPPLIARLRKQGATVVVPATPSEARDAAGAERLRQVPGARVMGIEEAMGIDVDGDGRVDVQVESVAMYDLIPGDPFHARGEGNGYVVGLGGVRIYFAGVTECTPEVRALRDIDVAFIPMNLPHGRMPPEVAAECVRGMGPDVVYPYHYRERPIDAFVDALRGTPIEVRLHDWYPAGP